MTHSFFDTLAGLSRADIDSFVDAGSVEVEMASGKWWQVRRNGATQTWKSNPGNFRIPVKAGFRTCTAITQTNLHYFRVRTS